MLQDLGSKSGTHVRGVCLIGAAELHDGDEIAVASALLLFRAGFAIVIGLAAGVYPALRASRLTPVDAIRAG